MFLITICAMVSMKFVSSLQPPMEIRHPLQNVHPVPANIMQYPSGNPTLYRTHDLPSNMQMNFGSQHPNFPLNLQSVAPQQPIVPNNIAQFQNHHRPMISMGPHLPFPQPINPTDSAQSPFATSFGTVVGGDSTAEMVPNVNNHPTKDAPAVQSEGARLISQRKQDKNPDVKHLTAFKTAKSSSNPRKKSRKISWSDFVDDAPYVMSSDLPKSANGSKEPDTAKYNNFNFIKEPVNVSSKNAASNTSKNAASNTSKNAASNTSKKSEKSGTEVKKGKLEKSEEGEAEELLSLPDKKSKEAEIGTTPISIGQPAIPVKMVPKHSKLLKDYIKGGGGGGFLSQDKIVKGKGHKPNNSSSDNSEEKKDADSDEEVDEDEQEMEEDQEDDKTERKPEVKNGKKEDSVEEGGNSGSEKENESDDTDSVVITVKRKLKISSPPKTIKKKPVMMCPCFRKCMPRKDYKVCIESATRCPCKDNLVKSYKMKPHAHSLFN